MQAKMLLKFDSLVFLECFADELQACAHISEPTKHSLALKTAAAPPPQGHSPKRGSYSAASTSGCLLFCFLIMSVCC